MGSNSRGRKPTCKSISIKARRIYWYGYSTFYQSKWFDKLISLIAYWVPESNFSWRKSVTVLFQNWRH